MVQPSAAKTKPHSRHPQKTKYTVAEYLAKQIDASGRKQKDIATDLGYEKPNMVTMLKQGWTKLPIDKVGPMAKALGVDPVHLLRRVMAEYYPNSWTEIEAILGATPISENEAEILNIVRLANPNDPAIANEEQRNALRKWVQSISPHRSTSRELPKKR